jgi:hypothetical protein
MILYKTAYGMRTVSLTPTVRSGISLEEGKTYVQFIKRHYLGMKYVVVPTFQQFSFLLLILRFAVKGIVNKGKLKNRIS